MQGAFPGSARRFSRANAIQEVLTFATQWLLFGQSHHLGGWSAPFEFLSFIPGIFWFVLKIFFLLSVFIWARATFPRYRYDQIMRLGWKVFIPVSVVWLVVVGFWIMSPLNIWK